MRRKRMIKTFDYAKTIKQLKTQLAKLQQDKEKLRIFLHETIEAYYRTINQTENQENFCLKCGCKEENHE